ncbi:hypothetical protein P1P68_09300 [Streptomyces scabiei]|uniref:hypothetical protein n=1 Tax=Streptomyces scabiei TaxID=1930 RepID=UPI00298FCDDA|nr:hypothetical protein [Streptomyces scabiei]MDW8804977.1 hypothetical protein [Streptomyces scabiei]
MVGADWAVFVVGLVFFGLPVSWMALLLVLGWSENGWGSLVWRVVCALCMVAAAASLAWHLASRGVECRRDPSSSACVPVVP